MANRFLNAYYFAFNATGVDEIDAMLERVAIAGKAYHHTNGWNESDGDEPSMSDEIQRVANESAAEIRKLQAQLAAMAPVVEAAEKLNDAVQANSGITMMMLALNNALHAYRAKTQETST